MSSIQKFWRDNHTVTTSDFGGTHTQCKYVPTTVVDALIEKHGGLKS